MADLVEGVGMHHVMLGEGVCHYEVGLAGRGRGALPPPG